MTHTLLTRREALSKVSAGTLLALGLWPGALRARDRRPARAFRFVVVNDTHLMSAECAYWLQKCVQQMRRHRPAFCLLAGDLTEHGGREDLAAVKEIFEELRAPVYPVIGNHDYFKPNDRRAYVELFPNRLNYTFDHAGWQFVGLDTTEGQKYQKTAIQPETLDWARAEVQRLNRFRPTVIFTHFPLGPDVRYRPTNADALLEIFRDVNLQAVFCGHFHGFTERFKGGVVLTTDRCCALKRANHDKSKEKGYFVCTVDERGLRRRFIECRPFPNDFDDLARCEHERRASRQC